MQFAVISEGAYKVNIEFTRVAPVLHGILGNVWKCPEIQGFRWQRFATRFGKKKPASQRANVFILLDKELVAGAEFLTFRTPFRQYPIKFHSNQQIPNLCTDGERTKTRMGHAEVLEVIPMASLKQIHVSPV